MIILGINAYHGDVSSVLLRDGELIAAVEEERFRRVKHWAGFPAQSIRECLKMGGVKPENIDHFAISRNPRANLIRKGLFILRRRPSFELLLDRWKNTGKMFDLGDSISEAISLDVDRIRARLHWVEHHPAHLASTFYVSPFEEAAVCAIDGFGDFVSTSWAIGREDHLDFKDKIYFPHSLGILYLAITQYLGFLNYGDEFKVMGLAPYGKPEHVDSIRKLVKLLPEGRFKLDLSFFRHWSEGVKMIWNDGEPKLGRVYTPVLETLLGLARKPEEPLEPRHESIAASLQMVFEEVAFHILNAVHKKSALSRLCLAGGCAMNSVMNGKIRENTNFREVYIQPASADNGTALGAAFYVWNQVLNRPRKFVMDHGYWGPDFTQDLIDKELAVFQEQLDECNCKKTTIRDEEFLCRWTAEKISEGNIIGWFQGRMEWGARALGNRSILADPRRENMRDIINIKIKFREKFRPFASVVLEEKIDDYFVRPVPDPFMIQVCQIKKDKRHVIPAVTHVDGSGRLQTIRRGSNQIFWCLLKAFEEKTGIPILLNTSFNENEPIVHKPAEAMDCFLRTGMDVLVIGQTVFEKPNSGDLEKSIRN